MTRGQVAAIVLQSATTPISANVNRINSQATLQAGGGFPYGQGITSGSTYGATPSIPCVAVRYDTGEWVFIDDAILPIQSFAASAFNTDTGATTGTRRGLRFQLPFPGRLNGCWAKLSFPTTADFDIILYNGAGTALQTMLSAFDANQQRVASTSGLYKFLFDGTYDLAAATEYFLAFVPTTANSLTLAEFAVNAAAHMDAIAGGQAFHLAKFVSSAWSKVTTERPWMGVLVSAFDDGTGGGSSGGGPLIGGRLIQ